MLPFHCCQACMITFNEYDPLSIGGVIGPFVEQSVDL